MTKWHDIASLDDLRRDGRIVARVEGREIGVVLDGAGSAHAVRNRCPHHGAPLCLGSVRDRAEGTAGRYLAPSREILRCPWHGWEFDLATGRCDDDGAMRVKVYPVRLSEGRVLVEA
jgi:nitrite reductase (NADH) small subunit